MASSGGVRNGVGPRMSAKPDRQGFSATPKTAAGKQRLSSAAGGAYRRTSSGPLPSRAASDGGGFVWLALALAPPLWSCGVGSGFGFWLCGGLGGFVDGFGAALICIWVTWLASLFPSRCCSIRCLHSRDFVGIFTLFIHVRKFSRGSLVPI